MENKRVKKLRLKADIRINIKGGLRGLDNID